MSEDQSSPKEDGSQDRGEESQQSEPVEVGLTELSEKRWYVLRVASNREEQVRDTLLKKVEVEGLSDEIGRVLVPTEKIKRVRGSQQRVYERKLYPGYVFVEMALTEEGNIPERSWFVIKETSGVGDFIGTEGKPSSMSEVDVVKMLNQSEREEDSPSIQMEFNKGDQIKVRGGSFEGFEGTVEAIDPEKGTVRVIVTIFGRATPLDIEYWQLEKA